VRTAYSDTERRKSCLQRWAPRQDANREGATRGRPRGKAPADTPALKPYWGKLAVLNFRGVMETSASCEARSAPSSYPTGPHSPIQIWALAPGFFALPGKSGQGRSLILFHSSFTARLKSCPDTSQNTASNLSSARGAGKSIPKRVRAFVGAALRLSQS
jgi:hypothetical protein